MIFPECPSGYSVIDPENFESEAEFPEEIVALFAKNCYRFIPQKMTFYSAKSLCESEGASLIDSKDKGMALEAFAMLSTLMDTAGGK